VLDDLEPRLLWQHFARICTFPHCSEHEAALRDDLLSQARERGWKGEVDDVGNLIVRVPAKPGCESAPTVVFQGHLDMVCEKNNDTDHDFATQGIEAYVDGDLVRARGTTLGADNGIGVAAALAIADDPEVPHGPLEIFCTVEEETGLTGAAGIDASMITGRILLNLDTEEEGAVYIGCAGGGDQHGEFRLPRQAQPEGSVAVELKVGGLLGGHSGLDAHVGRGNAIVLLVATIAQGIEDNLIVAVDTFAGGNMHNAIPREARGIVRIAEGKLPALQELVQARLSTAKSTLGEADPGVTITASEIEAEGPTILPADIGRFLQLLLELPVGVVAMSESIEGLVETSNNLAVVKDKDGVFTVLTSSRSSVEAALTKVRDEICSAIESAGGTVDREEGYPGWEPNVDSALLARAKRVHEKEFGTEPVVKAIHAGLECGIIGERIPGMDMISIGPSIFAPHSPDERISISSVQRFWVYLKGLMADLTIKAPR
jgi:dipeptidase D